MRAYERFLKYAAIHTTSGGADTAPSSACQWDLARLLEAELKELGLSDVRISEFGVAYAVLPATAGHEEAPALGFIAHMDTAPDFSGENVKPVLHENYDGGDIVLPKEGRVIRVQDFPALVGWKGRTVITADGSTLLGADDKAGIAEIMTLCETLITENIPHGKLCIAFTPDEEIGRGASHFDVEGFGAKYAYTVDGGLEGAIDYENFNAASASIGITGVSVHPGSAKNVMENALLIAMEINAALPADETPAHTEGYEGFFHLTGLHGDNVEASMSYIIRDHDMEKFRAKKAIMETATAFINQKYGDGTVKLSIRDSYFNMREKIEPCMYVVERAMKAMKNVGMNPIAVPIRGGTDGARLSYMGLPCPNLCTGGENYHGRFEYIPVEDMDLCTRMLVEILTTL